jgi:bacterioferritin
MNPNSTPTKQSRTNSGNGHLALDPKALEAAKRSLDDGAVTPHFGPWREDIIKLLNDSLATELVCVMRYKRHHFTAVGLASPAIADEFLVHANEEMGHADKLAQRIVQLGGEPDFNPQTLTQRSHAERVAIEAYSQMIDLIGDKDPTTRRLIESILEQEQEHADELSDWLEK